MDRREFVAGWAAGAVGQLSGHPLDTIKVRMQASAGTGSQKGVLQCAAEVYGGGGLRGFFRGLSVPLLAKGAEQCVAFGVRGGSERALDAVGWQESRMRSGVAGAAAGAATAALLTPVYLVKVQLQVSTTEGVSGPVAAAARAVAAMGPRGLYAGATPIMCGTTVAYACRFACYQRAVDDAKQLGAGDTAAVVIGGGIAGMATWASHYPLDLLSARVQARVGTQMPQLGMLEHGREILATDGVRGLYRGLLPCLVRAFPVNAIIFLAYERSMDVLSA